MRLNRIEMYGFKSFGKKTVLHFDDPVTVIVGPNGSGKSNIADAVRWALGEQSVKSLRGAKMEDIIFSGGAEKKPLNMAQVTLTFTNSEGQLPVPYQEIEIRRTLFRSGETKYEINQSPCRLKDIRNLFLDTGVGKEGYSIIGQGKIDEIVNAKEQDRRNLFEEATGIAKDRQQIEEASQKLRKTEENLVRVHDILSQYKEQIGFLYKESERAKKGMALSKELEIHTIAYYQKEMQQLKKQIVDLQEKREALLLKWKDDEKELTRVKENIACQDAMNESFLEEYNETDQLERQLERRLENTNRELLLATQRLQFVEKEQERVIAFLEEAQKEHQKLTLKERDFHEKMEEEQKVLATLKKDFSHVEEERKLLGEDLVALRETVENLEQKQKVLSDQVQEEAYAKRQRENQKEQLSLLEKDYMDAIQMQEGQVASLVEEASQIQQKIDENRQTIAKISEERKQATEKVQLLLARSKQREDSYRSVLRRINVAEERLKNILYAEENHDLYFRPNQRLLKEAKHNSTLRKQLLGPLGDLIQVQKEARLAIEMAMGAALQNIVTENKNQAKFLIDWLRDNKVGRVTFLPLDNIARNNYKGSMPSTEEGALGGAMNFVSASPEILPLLENLLGRTCIISSLDAGIRLRATPEYRGLRFVTIDGDIFQAGGQMVGGYTKNTGGILTRETEKETLQKEIDALQSEQKGLEEEEAKEEKEKQHLEDKMQTLQATWQEIESKSREDERQKSQCTAQIDVYKQQIDQTRIRLENTKNQLQHPVSGVSSEELSKKLQSIETILSEKREGLRQKENVRVDIETKAMEYRMRLDAKERDLLLLSNEERDIEEQIEKEKSQIHQYEREIASFKEQIQRENASIQENEKQMQIDETKLEETKKKLSMMATKEKEMREEKEKLRTEESRLEKEVYTAEQEKNAAEVKLETAVDRHKNLFELIADELGWDEERVEQAMDSPQELTTTKKKLKEIKDALRALGSFSYESIEAYREMKEKQGFLQEQSEDLKKSKEDLITVIQKLEVTMRRQFRQGMREINEKFQEIFTILFEGGQAEVTLTGEDVLTAGVQIIARPPGKQRQALSLLSGGEKALTAVALLFAIFETRPSPFCLLDEIDAALDDANIERYKAYLASFRNRIQFIIISHRKKTMELADFIYGVTMEKNTMSQIVPLEIKKARKEHV